MFIDKKSRSNIERYETARAYLECLRIRQWEFNRTIGSLQRLYNDYKRNSIIHRTAESVLLGQLTVDIAATALDNAYHKGA